MSLIIWGMLAVGCNNDRELQDQKVPRIEKNVEEAKLIEALDSFNAALSEQLQLPRQYDMKTNTIINKPVTRSVDLGEIFAADAKGAYSGAKKGASKGKWGRIGGAILYGAVASALEAINQDIDNGGVEAPVLCAMVQDESIFIPDSLYNLGVEVETVYVGTAEESVGDDVGVDEINVGIGHNLLLAALLSPPSNNTNNGGGPDTGGGDGGELDIVEISFADMYGENISADILGDDVFEEEFADFVTKCIQKKQGNIPLDEEDTVSDTVMNLFLEAAALCNGPGSLLDSVVAYYNEYIANSTALTEDDKQNTCLGMVVAVYSINYWNNPNGASGDDDAGDENGNSEEGGSGEDSGEGVEP